jgi:hypothetical protein
MNQTQRAELADGFYRPHPPLIHPFYNQFLDIADFEFWREPVGAKRLGLAVKAHPGLHRACLVADWSFQIAAGVLAGLVALAVIIKVRPVSWILLGLFGAFCLYWAQESWYWYRVRHLRRKAED